MLSRSQLVLRAAVRSKRGYAVRYFSLFQDKDQFAKRHLGVCDSNDETDMLTTLNSKYASMDDMIVDTIPASILNNVKFDNVPKPCSETQALAELQAIAKKNKVLKSYIGMGYYGTKTPSVLQRNMLENPSWYTAYTPYQAEVSQGRLEMLLNFQTMISDLTELPVANCSLLDEGSAAAEAMNMCYAALKKKRNKFFVSEDCHPQTIACVQTRGDGMHIEVVVGNTHSLMENPEALTEYCGVLVQYPCTYGSVHDYSALSNMVHENGSMLCAAADLMALTLLKSPGSFQADICVGSSQRFGVPMFYGGPHAGYMSVQDNLKRLMPGRLIGVSVDSQGNRALRMALQTREQFIKRDKATSNICTAQALLANVACAYGIFHGPDGLKAIAADMHLKASCLEKICTELGFKRYGDSVFFDTITLEPPQGISTQQVLDAGVRHGLNLRVVQGTSKFGISIDETTTENDLVKLVQALLEAVQSDKDAASLLSSAYSDKLDFGDLTRTTPYMQHPVFNSHHSETQMLRYLGQLEKKDVTLKESMISLGSCTMKLNATSELMPISWPELSSLHPFAPVDQCQGSIEMIESLNAWLCSITGFAAVSTQPNSGATGEYAGLLCIKEYHKANGEDHRNVCLIPQSAHGTNPASAVMAGMKVVGISNNDAGEVDIDDLRAKVEKHKDNLAAIMITYPSTYGVFEEGINDIIDAVHAHGGQVYMDGANMNAQLGMTSPGDIKADVCHLNLHKTFAIPHGGGGPGVGSIGVAAHLAPFLPGHVVLNTGGEGVNVVAKSSGAVAAAPYGSAGVLPISWMFIRMMGDTGLKKAAQVAILNANYMATRLEKHFKILFRNKNGRCAHEFIVDLRQFKQHGISEDDVAKRLADYGFHAPTMSWPVPGTIMIEPTESESKAECNRLVDALISIRGEIQDVIDGKIAAKDSPLKNAPHTAAMVTSDDWNYKYTRKQAAFPMKFVEESKFWPTVSRVDNVYGDRNLMCTCPSVAEFEEQE